MQQFPMKRFSLRAFLLSAVLVTACNTATPTVEEPTLEEYASEAGGFTISTPLTLDESSQSVDTQAGPIDIYTFTAEDNQAAYIVAYSDYPEALVTQSEPDIILDGSRDGAVGNVGGTLINETRIDLQGNPGRALVIDTTTDDGQDATVNARIYLVDNRLYQVLVVVPKGDEDEVDADGFLDSFSLSTAP